MGDGTKTYLVWTQKDHLADEVSGHGEQSLEETVMNRNRKCSKKVAAGIAVGMAAVMAVQYRYWPQKRPHRYQKKRQYTSMQMPPEIKKALPFQAG